MNRGMRKRKISILAVASMSAEQNAQEVTSPNRKERRSMKNKAYVPPVRRELDADKKSPTKSNPVSPNKSPPKAASEEEKKVQQPGHNIRIPKILQTQSQDSGRSSPEMKKGRNAEPLPNCCDDDGKEEGELDKSPAQEEEGETIFLKKYTAESVSMEKLAISTKQNPVHSVDNSRKNMTPSPKPAAKKEFGQFVKMKTITKRSFPEKNAPARTGDMLQNSNISTSMWRNNAASAGNKNDDKRRRNPRESNAQDDGFTLEQFTNIEVLYIDSHCHTDFIYNQMKCSGEVGLKNWIDKFPKAFPRAFDGCIANFIQPSLFIDNETTRKERTFDLDWIKKEICETMYYAGTTWGCHPHYAQKWAHDSRLYDQLEMILGNRGFRAVAVGECGIDLNRCESTLDNQKTAFRKQIRLAFKYDLALVIHCRKGEKGDSEAICLEILKEELQKCHRYLRIHRHCYTESWQNAQEWIQTCPNIVFGFTPGIFSFRAEQIEAVRRIPLDRIVLETDAPYFKIRTFDDVSPQKVSLPGMAASVAFRIAKIKNLPVDEVLRAAHCNTRRIYQI